MITHVSRASFPAATSDCRAAPVRGLAEHDQLSSQRLYGVLEPPTHLHLG